MTREKRDIVNAQQRVRRAEQNNAGTKAYEKTKKGFLMRLYRNMESRINGIQKLKFHLYQGKDLLPRQDFYVWALLNKDFHSLFEAYEQSGYDMRLSPSVDRINSKLGYIIENMEFVTQSENSRRGSISKGHRKAA